MTASSAPGRLIRFGLLQLWATAFLTNAEQHYDTDIVFDRSMTSASHVASEAEKRFLLTQLNVLEQASPAQTKQETIQFLQRVQNTCKKLKQVDPAPPGHCPYFYDSFSCWRPAPIGNYSVKSCPKYILGMHTPDVEIEIFCKPENFGANSTESPMPIWDYVSTNESHFLQLYGSCFESSPKTPSPTTTPSLHLKLQAILQKTQMVGPICYSISFVALAVASLIFILFKRLHCPRNFIHLHLFLAFMIRATMCLLQYYTFENGRGMTIDGDVTEENGVLKFVKGGSHWECKLVIAIWNYSLVASYFWLLVEGLYLHNVVYFFVFRETGIAGYAIFGWVAPLLVLVPWIAVKVLVEDHLCWVSYLNLNYFWILRGPIMATIIINFLLFINMIRELFLKLKDSHITETRRYRKLAKSSVLLVVILGVYYFIISIPMLLLDTDQLTWPLLICLSVEHIFGSLQGLMVALVYCFMNSEVRGVVRKRWYRWILLRQVSSGTYCSSATAGTGLPSRQGSAAAGALIASLQPRLSNGLSDPRHDENADDLSTRIRRTLFQRKSNPIAPRNGERNSVAKRVLSCSPASTLPSPTLARGERCVIGGDLCVNCRLSGQSQSPIRICDRAALVGSGSPTDTPTHQGGGILKKNAVGAAEERSALIISPAVAAVVASSSSSATSRSQSLVGGEKEKGAVANVAGGLNGSIRMRHQRHHHPRKETTSGGGGGDTIALLRMRSPHSLDMQELSRGTRRRSRDETDPCSGLIPPPPTKFLRASTGDREVNRRYSLNSSVVSYSPLNTLKTMTAANNRTGPLVTGCWQKQTNDAFL